MSNWCHLQLGCSTRVSWVASSFCIFFFRSSRERHVFVQDNSIQFSFKISQVVKLQQDNNYRRNAQVVNLQQVRLLAMLVIDLGAFGHELQPHLFLGPELGLGERKEELSATTDNHRFTVTVQSCFLAPGFINLFGLFVDFPGLVVCSLAHHWPSLSTLAQLNEVSQQPEIWSLGGDACNTQQQ